MAAVGAFLVSSASAWLVGSPAQPMRPHAVARSAAPVAADIWTPSSRGEEGKTPRDLEFGPLGQYCPDLYEVARRTTRTVCSPPGLGRHIARLISPLGICHAHGLAGEPM